MNSNPQKSDSPSESETLRGIGGTPPITPKVWGILILILLFGSLLRIHKLTYWSIWNDEGHTYDCALVPLFSPESKEPMAKAYPVNFYITRVFIDLFGKNELGGRLFPCIMGILSLPLVFFATRSFFRDNRIALWSTAIVSGSSWHLEWSQSARHFALLFFLVTLMLWLFYRGIEKNGPWHMVAALFCLGLAVFTHLSGSFSVPGLFVFSLILISRKSDRPKEYRLRNLVIFWLPIFLVFLAMSGKFFSLLRYLTEDKTTWNPAWNVMGSVVFYLGIPMLVLSGWAFWMLIRRRDRRGYFFASVLVSQAVSLTALCYVTVASGAYNLTALWPLAMGVSWLGVTVAEGLPKPGRLGGAAIPAAIFLAYLGSTALYFGFEHGNRPRWREAFDFVKARMAPEDGVVCESGSVGNFYFGYPEDPARQVRWLNSLGLDIEKARTGNQRLWLLPLRATSDLTGPGEEINRFLREECRFLESFRVNTGIKERNIEVYLYTPPAYAGDDSPDES